MSMASCIDLLNSDLYSETSVAHGMPPGSRVFVNPPGSIHVGLFPNGDGTCTAKVWNETTHREQVNEDADGEWLDEVLP